MDALILASVNQLTSNPTVAVIGGIFIVTIIFVMIGFVVWIENHRKLQETREREQTKREIAAYVAEGSMNPDDAAKILSAGASLKDSIRLKLGV